MQRIYNMAKSNTNPSVDFYFMKAGKWQHEMNLLRTIVLSCELTEVLKWGCPCYTVENGNVVIIHSFKEYCALLFVKGALLKDTNNILIQQTENVQAGRQIRFTDNNQIIKQERILKSYIKEATNIEKAGMKVKLKTIDEYAVPEEFKIVLNKNTALKKAFGQLTPGRQRAYLFYFAQAKQTKTRELRIEKCIPQILNGKGLND